MSAELFHSETVFNAVESGTAAARSRLAASWRRSLIKHGLDPARQTRVDRLDETALKDRRNGLEQFRGLASDELDRLCGMVGGSGFGVFLTDTEGVILDRRCQDGDRQDFESWGLSAGTDWSEAAEGTNGIGTCLAEMRSVVIHRDQHFCTQNTGLSCIGTPIYGARGELIAALDVSSARRDQTQSLNLLIAGTLADSARRIEAAYFRERHQGARILIADTGKTEGSAMLAVDNNDIVVGATRAARLAFDLGIDTPIDAVPAVDIFGQTRRGLAAAERSELIRALARARGNVSAAAKDLGVGRATLYRRMQSLKIEKSDLQPSQN
ncbi:MAG: GAF domain-containing protein [Pseudomonadota bacterium]